MQTERNSYKIIMRLLFSIIAIFLVSASAVAQNKVYICKKNGLVDAYDVSAVDSITFSKPDASSGLLLKPTALLAPCTLSPTGIIRPTTEEYRSVAMFDVSGIEEVHVKIAAGSSQYSYMYVFSEEPLQINDTFVLPSNPKKGLVYEGSPFDETISTEGHHYLYVSFNNQRSQAPVVTKVSKETDNNEKKLCDSLKTCYSDIYKNDARKLKRNLRILGIGNSWTLNCTQHLGYILDNLGINAEIYRSFAGSAPLEMYWTDVSSDDAKFEFSYRKPFGEYESLGLKSIKEILETEQFDIVVFQQVSQDAGKYSTYQPYLNNLIDWTKSIKEIVPDIYFHSTWAYPDGCTHWGFPNYNNDNATMYKAILSATNQMIEETGISLIIPNAPNIQQACEADETGLFWQQDEGQGYYGRHLQNGCYSAACVWAETFIQKFFDSKILKKSVEDCTYYGPYNMETAKKMQKIAHDVVTNIKMYYPKAK